MGVLAHDERLGRGGGLVGLAVSLQFGLARIHGYKDVDVRIDRLRLLRVPDGLDPGVLVLHGPRGVEALEPHVRPMVVHAVAGLVPEGPDDHAGVVLVALHVALHSSHVALAPHRSVPERLVPHEVDAVTLDVGLVHDLHPRDEQRVQVRRLCGPGPGARNRGAPRGHRGGCRAPPQRRGEGRHEALAVEEAAAEALLLGHAGARERQVRVDLEQAVGGGPHLDVADVVPRPGEDEDVALDAREPPHVLVLEVGLGAPAEHLHGQGVAALDDLGREVELDGQLAVRAVSQHLRLSQSCERGAARIMFVSNSVCMRVHECTYTSLKH